MSSSFRFNKEETEKKALELQLKEYHEKLEKSYENLRESEEMFRDLFDNANDAIFTCDAQGHIIIVNKAGVRLSGCDTKDEIIGARFSDWLTSESLKQARENMRKYFSGEDVKQPVIYEFIQKNGEHRWAEVRSRILNKNDKAIALQCIARDITERKKLEQELKESEARYRDLFENAIIPMYIFDTNGNILKMNSVGLQLLGCKEEEVIGTNMSEWLSPESLKIAQERLKKRLLGDSVDQTEIVEFVCKNGEHRWAEVKSRSILTGCRRIEIHGIARDITENKRLKQELKNSDKQRKLLCYLIQGSRGGKTRALILRKLTEKSYNANQLAKAMNMDYKTIRHHLDVLAKKGMITRGQNEYIGLYFISKNIESDLNAIDLGLKRDKT